MQRCPFYGKICYATRNDVRAALAVLRQRRLMDKRSRRYSRHPEKAYHWCEHCYSYHTTHNPRGMGKRKWAA